MHYDYFCEIAKTELPINRKERFYTGTVLPAILFHSGLSNFYAFLTLIDGFPEEINETATGDSFLFYTEYNLKESAGERSAGQIIHTITNDTPDMVIEILKPKKIFIIIEGKMFAAINQEDLAEQINRQKKYITDPILKRFDLFPNDVFHIALLPEALRIANSPGFLVLNWEKFFDNKKFDCRNNYFFNYLRYAIDNYDKLVQKNGWVLPTHVESYLPGREIYNRSREGDNIWVGRKGGNNTFVSDIISKTWDKRKYCVSSSKPSKGLKGQWISGDEFSELVDNYCP